MIKSFRDKQTEDAFNGIIRKGFPADLIKVARRKLGYLNAAVLLSDLQAPPGNRLEALKGDRAGQYSRQRPVPDLLRLDQRRTCRRRIDRLSLAVLIATRPPWMKLGVTDGKDA